jgi:hypothetical protein
MVWDDSALYVAFHCEDSDLHVSSRDQAAPGSQDRVGVLIMEQSMDRGHFLHYVVDPGGSAWHVYNIQPDAAIPGWSSPGFEAVATADGSINRPDDSDTGYVVEMKIPFDDLHLQGEGSPSHGDTMRLNLLRMSSGAADQPGETGVLTWSHAPASRVQEPDRFGRISFSRWPAGSLPDPEPREAEKTEEESQTKPEDPVQEDQAKD